jgi:signal transduction histidine kinase
VTSLAPSPPRKQSIATRVAVAGGTAAAVAALVGALSTGIFASELLYDHAEDAAHSTARALANELHEEAASGPAHERIQDEIVHFGRIEARYVVSEAGAEIFRSPLVQGERWPAPDRCASVEGGKSIACTSEVGTIRVVALVAIPLDEATLVLVALVAAALAALIGSLIAWRSTRTVLEPLPRLARGASAIEPGRLDLGALGEDDGIEELDALRGQLRTAFRRADEALSTVARFGANAAHELRSPLAALRAEVELAIEQQHMDVETMKDVRARVMLLSDLIERLLVLASPRERIASSRETVSLREIAEDVLARPPTTVEAAARVRAELDPSSEEGRVNGDRALLRALVENAVGNACKFAQSKARARVRRIGSEVVLEVEDDGPGLGDEDLERVFEPFFRTERARASEVGGHGLGLALVSHIARMHGGQPAMTRGGLGGACLRITLPASLD